MKTVRRFSPRPNRRIYGKESSSRSLAFFDVVFFSSEEEDEDEEFSAKKKSRRRVLSAYDTDSRETARTCSFARVRTRNQVGASARERVCVLLFGL